MLPTTRIDHVVGSHEVGGNARIRPVHGNRLHRPDNPGRPDKPRKNLRKPALSTTCVLIVPFWPADCTLARNHDMARRRTLKRRTCLLLSLCALAYVTIPAVVRAQSGSGLEGSYYLNTEFAGQPALTRIDPIVNFTLSSTGPAALDMASGFSARWSGQLQAPVTGRYVFAVQADGGVRLWMGGRLLIDRWTKKGKAQASPIELTAGQRYEIQIDYVGNLNGASVQLFWSHPGQTEQIVPQQALYPALVQLQRVGELRNSYRELRTGGVARRAGVVDHLPRRSVRSMINHPGSPSPHLPMGSPPLLSAIRNSNFAIPPA